MNTKLKLPKIKPLHLFLVMAMLFSLQAKGQLSGTYTIDPSPAASKTNYKNIKSAIADLDSGYRFDGGIPNGKGVSGKVVFEIADGIYADTLIVKPISGATDTSTIT